MSWPAVFHYGVLIFGTVTLVIAWRLILREWRDSLDKRG